MRQTFSSLLSLFSSVYLWNPLFRFPRILLITPEGWSVGACVCLCERECVCVFVYVSVHACVCVCVCEQLCEKWTPSGHLSHPPHPLWAIEPGIQCVCVW